MRNQGLGAPPPGPGGGGGGGGGGGPDPRFRSLSRMEGDRGALQESNRVHGGAPPPGQSHSPSVVPEINLDNVSPDPVGVEMRV